MLRSAGLHPEFLAIGVDASADSLIDPSRRARKQKLHNAVFLVADAREALTLFHGRISELRITLPWGSLLRAILDGEEAFMLAVAGSL